MEDYQPSVGITVSDIKRATLDAGDVSTFTKAWHQALGNSPVPSISSLEVPVELPETTALLKHIDKNLAGMVATWAEGKDCQPFFETINDLTLIGLAPYGQNTGKYLEHVINEAKPDIIAIDTPPLELSASMLYALSIPCAAGLPVHGVIVTKDFRQFYARETFYPGNTNETAIIKSWLTKTPLLPAGIPRLKPTPMYSEMELVTVYMDETSVEREMYKSSVLKAYRALDESLSNVTKFREGLKISRDICLSLTGSTSGKMRETLVEEACYIVSRIMEIATYVNTSRRKTRLLAIVDITRFLDIEYVIGLLKQGITDEIYVPPKSYATAEAMLMVSRNSDELNEEAKEYIPKVTLAQELFQSELAKLIEAKNSKVLTEYEVDKLITQITSRTRTHPDIARGTSVRGAIALREVLQGLGEMQSGLTRNGISKAALITLPPRIAAKQEGNETAIVNDIVKEVLYDIQFSDIKDEGMLSEALGQLSSEDILENLKNLKPFSPEHKQELPQKEIQAIIAEQDKIRERLKYLESKYFTKKGWRNQSSFIQKAVEYLMNELEQKLKADQITLTEYNREKSRLAAMLKDISKPQLKMSAEELAATIMEMMDAQDKQWSSELSFERMHVYYHIKANSVGEELSPQKRDYYGLKMLIDYLEKQGILSTMETASGLTLTSQALNIVLKYLIPRGPKGRGLQGAIDSGSTPASERKYEIRRYNTGDIFRDISVRHTLREIARQKRDLSSVNRNDFRVFMKQRRKLQSDIVLCLDISGSMGFRSKLMYARLAASGLAKAALENGDRVGIAAFNNVGQTVIPLTDKDEDAILNYIARLSARANTNIGDGIKCSSELFFHNQSRNQKYIVLITDGQPTAISEGVFDQLKGLKGSDLTEESAMLETKKASARGIKVSVIHITGEHERNNSFVKNIARIGKGKVLHMSSPEDLKTIMR